MFEARYERSSRFGLPVEERIKAAIWYFTNLQVSTISYKMDHLDSPDEDLFYTPDYWQSYPSEIPEDMLRELLELPGDSTDQLRALSTVMRSTKLQSARTSAIEPALASFITGLDHDFHIQHDDNLNDIIMYAINEDDNWQTANRKRHELSRFGRKPMDFIYTCTREFLDLDRYNRETQIHSTDPRLDPIFFSIFPDAELT